MRNLKSIIAILLFSFTITFSANASEKDPSKVTTELRSEIVNILGNKIPLEVESSSSEEVSFMINNKNELVVISVDSNLNSFNVFVKEKLNYKIITTKGIQKGEIYKMPIKINKV
ncbi:MAG: hypothetical protein GW772_06615 [Flavobacteriia bacterium]|nr:hypothetical protein [Flavobacteriia bacterium]OIP45074.1 MAG: hypothetical protein AUK46_13165 [Flavobacteriaceae bacterium CG2_30_31_66]PIV95268.1 MAG: hypothetical protein COW43_14080 [Flavobacteriaceae bacterium CG17_big_fil_post_rev_8_21_14_2_50_31_13]PIX11398.1 MAG: hypothetical protein COZ74_14145 [Flavobacteriaceae bacterium CG_4_8_14_3_um_filter_31_8]PIY13599.1 MAG: hypothetical protein COZ16_13255 [Flavobacteriaceae bacterium CG_4_10_14_3_um_filter_31_253]PIZ11840.1 MAG: hypotheti